MCVLIVVCFPHWRTSTAAYKFNRLTDCLLQQTYILAWTKDGGRMGARVIDDGQGGLVFTNVTPEDAGTYTCTGSTFDGVDTDQAVLRVGGNVIVVYKCSKCYMWLVYTGKKSKGWVIPNESELFHSIKLV